jgi:hypothetical protein
MLKIDINIVERRVNIFAGNRGIMNDKENIRLTETVHGAG